MARQWVEVSVRTNRRDGPSESHGVRLDLPEEEGGLSASLAGFAFPECVRCIFGLPGVPMALAAAVDAAERHDQLLDPLHHPDAPDALIQAQRELVAAARRLRDAWLAWDETRERDGSGDCDGDPDAPEGGV